MNVTTFDISGVLLITPRRFSDGRGYFVESYNKTRFSEAAGLDVEFIQDNHSLSEAAYTVRGLHFQSPPHGQGKLVRCTRGRVIDVAVDARKGSATYGEHIRVDLTPENGAQLWVPVGFLHGFATLEPNTEIQYKCTDFYAPDCDGNILWNDPQLAIDWGFDPSRAVLSDKDVKAPRFSDFVSPF